MAGRGDRRTFSTEFKKEILNLADRGEETIANLAKKYDLTITIFLCAYELFLGCRNKHFTTW